MGKRKKKKIGRKHSSKNKFGMEKIKDIKLLHYTIPMRNANGICLIAETGTEETLFTSKHCFFVEETVGKKGHPVRNYSLDNKDYIDSMLNKFMNINIFVEFKNFDNKIKKDIKQYVNYYISMSHYPLSSKAEITLLDEQECYQLISSL